MSANDNSEGVHKWVVRYICPEGFFGMATTNHHIGLISILDRLLSLGARKITIIDETIYKE